MLHNRSRESGRAPRAPQVYLLGCGPGSDPMHFAMHGKCIDGGSGHGGGGPRAAASLDARLPPCARRLVFPKV